MESIILLADQYLIWFYRLTGHAGVDFAIGTFVLASICLLIGEATVFLIFLVLRQRFNEKAKEAAKYQDLSIEALKAGDKEAYNAANLLAKDAFGHSFFQQLTLSAAFLWPVFFALAWMQRRFLETEFPIPGTNWSLGFIGVFIIIYVTIMILFKQVKKRLTSVRRMKARQDYNLTQDENKAALPSPIRTQHQD